MALTDQQVLEGTNDRFTVEFNDGLATTDEELSMLASRMSESSIEVNHDTITLYLPEYDPALDEYDGEVNYDAGLLHAVKMVGKEYARGYQTPITELRNPVKREIHAANIRKLGSASNKTKVELAFMMLFFGDSAQYGLCYDGQPFLDAEHPGVDPYGNEVLQSNLFENMPLTKENVLAVLAAMTNYSNMVGQPFGNQWVGGQTEPSFRLWHGAALETQVAALKMPDPAAQNPLAGTFIPQKSRYFAGDHAEWWMIQFLAAGLPLALVDIDAYIDSQIDRGEKKRIKHQAHAEFALGYKHWHGVALCRS